MDIKLTCTGAIPLDDFPENQQFLVVSGINSIGPVLLYKCGNVLKNISNFHSIPNTQKFLAWEPINVEHYFSPYVTKDLWLISPDLFKPTGWVFKDYANPEKEYVCEIRDKEFIERWFKTGAGQFSCSCGDVYSATINNTPNDDGLHEIIRLCHIANKAEIFAKTFLGRE
ncbi:hypothetical protein [Parasutterella sp.]|uniref:hypothetical protein n=1 Tax=Parasutterella sp. TaxID=2049037 RepID=UPI0035219AF4